MVTDERIMSDSRAEKTDDQLTCHRQLYSWLNVFQPVLNALVFPCSSCHCQPFYFFNSSDTISTVIGTIICPVDNSRKVKLYIQKELGTFPFILLDLPLHISEFAGLIRGGTTRVVFSRPQNGFSSSTSIMPSWVMQCNGKRAGIARRREGSPKDKCLLDMIRAVSTGAGLLPCKASGGYKYLRCQFRQTVGSDGSEGYHLIDPSDCFHQDLSFFFIWH